MHALVVRVTIRDADRTREVPNSQVAAGGLGLARFSRRATGHGRPAVGG